MRPFQAKGVVGYTGLRGHPKPFDAASREERYEFTLHALEELDEDGPAEFIFEQVPARVCPCCGERYFAAGVVGRMDRQMKSHRPTARTISVPLISLRRGEPR